MIYLLYHHAAALPLLALLVAHWRQKAQIPPLYWVVAFAFYVSWLADSWFAFVDKEAYWLTYVYPSIQAAMVFWAVERLRTTDAARYAFVVALAAMSLGSLGLRASPYALEVWAHTVAAAIVVRVCWSAAWLGWLRPALLVYFGMGGLWWIGVVATYGPTPGPAFDVAFTGFQLSRMLGLALACYAMWRFRRHQLVVA